MSNAVPHQIISMFDPKWYLETYRDVAHAGVDPLNHFERFGWQEGRWPCRIEAVELDEAMWANQSPENAEQALRKIIESDTSFQRSLASWFLCRWFASWGKWDQARHYTSYLTADNDLTFYVQHEGPYLLAFTILLKCNETSLAKQLLANEHWLESANKTLARSMLETGVSKIRRINAIFEQQQLITLEETSPVTLDTVRANVSGARTTLGAFSPLVSVIIPCFNAQTTIPTALKSLLAQTYKKLEIIVVDDASTDDSEAAVKQLVTQDQRIKYVRLAQNSGAYAARNMGLQLSKGKFITTHDADDWSHPQKIALQVAALQRNRKTKATVSHWVRTTPELEFERWRMEDGWIYRNVSSLMFKRSVFRKLGFWDTVSVNADTEYYLRLQRKFGASAINEVLPGVPLAFGRVDEGSLTQTSATHLRTQFAGIRKDYIDSANTWHATARRLYMPKEGLRKFAAPPQICRGTQEARKQNLKDVLTQKNRFDSEWYLAAYPDIAAAGVNPLNHFINYGIDEGRDPNPYLSVSGLAYVLKTSHFKAVSQWASNENDESSLLFIPGLSDKQSSRKILMVAHLAGAELFGAERSFLDCVRMLHAEHAELNVILPSGINADYVEEIALYVRKIYFTPLPWWRKSRQEIASVTNQVEAIIRDTQSAVVYVNTLTLWEPHIAARHCNVKSIMHVRELPNHDEDLCKRLNASQEEIRQHIDVNSDLVIANSKVTAAFVDLPSKTTVIYNAVDIDKFKACRDKIASTTLNVVMLSSNTVKKGIDDVFKIAKASSDRNLDIRFFIWGPETPDLKSRLKQYHLGNLKYCGYTADPIEAYRNMDVVLNLSHFQESFGKTIIEGMASNCIPIGYSWGGLIEIIKSSYGFLAPFKNWNEIVTCLEAIARDFDKLEAMKQSAITTVEATYDIKVISKQLETVLCLLSITA